MLARLAAVSGAPSFRAERQAAVQHLCCPAHVSHGMSCQPEGRGGGGGGLGGQAELVRQKVPARLAAESRAPSYLSRPTSCHANWLPSLLHAAQHILMLTLPGRSGAGQADRVWRRVQAPSATGWGPELSEQADKLLGRICLQTGSCCSGPEIQALDCQPRWGEQGGGGGSQADEFRRKVLARSAAGSGAPSFLSRPTSCWAASFPAWPVLLRWPCSWRPMA